MPPNDPDFTGNGLTTPLACTSTRPAPLIGSRDRRRGRRGRSPLLLATQRDLDRRGDRLGVQEAANLVTRRQLDERRQLLGALRQVVLDASLASAARSGIRREGRSGSAPCPGITASSSAPPPDPGHRPDQPLGVGWRGEPNKVVRVRLLDDLRRCTSPRRGRRSRPPRRVRG